MAHGVVASAANWLKLALVAVVVTASVPCVPEDGRWLASHKQHVPQGGAAVNNMHLLPEISYSAAGAAELGGGGGKPLAHRLQSNASECNHCNGSTKPVTIHKDVGATFTQKVRTHRKNPAAMSSYAK